MNIIYNGLSSSHTYELMVSATNGDETEQSDDGDVIVNLNYQSANAVHPSTFSGIRPTTYKWESIGQKVAYTPDDGSFTYAKEELGNGNEHTVSTNKQVEWYIWGKDTRYIYLLGTRKETNIGVPGAVVLYGYKGYNNGVYYIDEICKTFYINNKIVSVAIGLKI